MASAAPSSTTSPSITYRSAAPATSGGSVDLTNSRAAAIFQESLSQSIRDAETPWGKKRLEYLDLSLKEHGLALPMSDEDRMLLKIIFASIKNPAIEVLPLFFALSIQQDFLAWAAEQQELPGKLEKTCNVFNQFCKEFIYAIKVEYMFRQDDPTRTGKSVIESFCKRLSKFSQFLPATSKRRGVIQSKMALWMKFAQSPSYPEIAPLQFVTEGVGRDKKEQMENQKGLLDESERIVRQTDLSAASYFAQSTPVRTAPDTCRIDVAKSTYLNDEQMLDFLIHYVDFSIGPCPQNEVLIKNIPEEKNRVELSFRDLTLTIKDHQGPFDGTFNDLLQNIKRKLIEIRNLIITDPSLAKGKIGPLLKFMKYYLDSFAIQSLHWREYGVHLNEIEAMIAFDECDFILRRLSASLNLMQDMRLFLMSERLHTNLLACREIEKEILREDTPLRFEFLDLYRHMEGTLGINEYWKEQLLTSSFDPLQTPSEMQSKCRRAKHNSMKQFTFAFEKLHAKYSRIASKLYSEGNIKEARALKTVYLNLCLKLQPAFFVMQDIANLKKNRLADRNTTIVPPEILDCWDLDIENAQEEIDSDDSNAKLPSSSSSAAPSSSHVSVSSPSQPPQSVIASAPVAAAPPLSEEDSEFRDEFSRLSRIGTLDREYVPRPQPEAQIAAQEPSIPRIRLPKKRWKLEQMIRRNFGLREGGDHTRVFTDDNKQATVMPRHGGGSEIRPGTHRAMERQLAKPAARKAAQKK